MGTPFWVFKTLRGKKTFFFLSCSSFPSEICNSLPLILLLCKAQQSLAPILPRPPIRELKTAIDQAFQLPQCLNSLQASFMYQTQDSSCSLISAEGRENNHVPQCRPGWHTQCAGQQDLHRLFFFGQAACSPYCSMGLFCTE